MSTVPEFAKVIVPVGSASGDGTVVVGRSGELFLVGGNNHLLRQWSWKPDRIQEVHEFWRSLFLERRRMAGSMGVRYVQTIIPEKLSVMHDLAPVDVDGPTPVLELLNRDFARNEWYLDALSVLSPLSRPYQVADSHLSPSAAQAVFAAMCGIFAPHLTEQVMDVPMVRSEWARGDLGAKFGDLNLYSEIELPDDAPGLASAEEVMRIEPESGHRGLQICWHNERREPGPRVLVFGNSFFGAGATPVQLSWWSRAYLPSVMFVWSPAVDWELVDEWRPDIVICQTVERFLPQFPAQ